MNKIYDVALSRRSFLSAGAGLALTPLLPVWPAQAAGIREYRIVAERSRVRLVGSDYPETEIWAYNGQVPGPEIRARQGERLKFVVENRLGEDTTVHSHGLRLPNAMDGVPHVTQKPIAPGKAFTYEFDVPDAGTYWYHPHSNSMEQLGRGLAGPLIIEDRDPIQVDRDIVWVLDDWRLTAQAAISDDFGNPMDMGMAGRLGNTVTVNGRNADTFEVRAGERIRLRLINTANARFFALDFAGHRPQVIAYDGQPVEPHEPAAGRIVLGPAMRADLVIDMAGDPKQSFQVVDRFYPTQTYKLLDLVYRDESPLRDGPLASPLSLPANTMPEPDIEHARRHEVAFGGGMMGGGMMGGGMMGGGMMGGGMMGGGMMGDGMMGGGMMGGMAGGGKMWTINGIPFDGPAIDPLLTLQRGQPHILALRNNTAWNHPIHLHGHSFRVIARNGQPTRYREWQDTVLIAPRETVDIAFVADNPGDWMFHCHIAEHLAGGMMGIIRVA